MTAVNTWTFRGFGNPVNSLRDKIDMLHGPPLQVISDCLRGFLIAKPGHVLVGCDFSAIEARVLAWLAGEEKILKAFRGDGKVYERAAADIYRVRMEDVTKEQRQIGKVAVLALGYQGGKMAFQTMAKTYGVKVSESEADLIKKKWREANPSIVKYWWDVEAAAKDAVYSPKTVFTAGPKYQETKYLMNGSFLLCQLPSKRVIAYPYPKIEEKEMPWGGTKPTLTYMAVNSLTKQWERHKAYGGLLVENITQAVARDVLASAIVRLEKNRIPVVLHVHDEVVVEVPETQAPGWKWADEVKAIVSAVPEWADGLPIAAEAWQDKRYQK